MAQATTRFVGDIQCPSSYFVCSSSPSRCGRATSVLLIWNDLAWTFERYQYRQSIRNHVLRGDNSVGLVGRGVTTFERRCFAESIRDDASCRGVTVSLYLGRLGEKEKKKNAMKAGNENRHVPTRYGNQRKTKKKKRRRCWAHFERRRQPCLSSGSCLCSGLTLPGKKKTRKGKKWDIRRSRSLLFFWMMSKLFVVAQQSSATSTSLCFLFFAP